VLWSRIEWPPKKKMNSEVFMLHKAGCSKKITMLHCLANTMLAVIINIFRLKNIVVEPEPQLSAFAEPEYIPVLVLVLDPTKTGIQKPNKVKISK
jgi:hypothetical protein